MTNPAGHSDASGLSRRGFLAAAVGLAVSSATGCAGIRGWRRKDEFAGRPRVFGPEPTVEEVVAHLNGNVDRLHSWRTSGARIRANNIPLTADLAVEKGQRMRLVVNSVVGTEVDLGSNDEVFWFWAKRNNPPHVFYANHEHLERARQQLQIPFEPAWLLEALSMERFDAEALTLEKHSEPDKCRLVATSAGPTGAPMRKDVVVDLQRGLVLEHSVFNASGFRIARAGLSQHGRDVKSGVVLPHKIQLEWPQAELSLQMIFDKLDINPPSIPQQVWAMPEMSGYRLVNLAEADVRQ